MHPARHGEVSEGGMDMVFAGCIWMPRARPRMVLPASAGRDYFARMAWRIHDSVIRGEIDNRVKGVVRGTLWLKGLSEPVTLELEGNACPDLAGCLLQFKSTAKNPSHAPEAEVRTAAAGAHRESVGIAEGPGVHRAEPSGVCDD